VSVPAAAAGAALEGTSVPLEIAGALEEAAWFRVALGALAAAAQKH